MGAARPAVCIVGTGSLGRSICYSIAASWRKSAKVVVVGRDPAQAAEVTYVAAARAALGAVPVHFESAANDLTDTTDLLGRLRPAIVVMCASVQSPWERSDGASAWTNLVARAGFGLTLPLQARLVIRLAEAIKRVCPDALLVNACYPDAVNSVLAALGLPVHCGIGNAAILAASLQASFGLTDQTDLRVLAHHAHLHAPSREDDDARAWLGDKPVLDVTRRLIAERACNRRELNRVTGYAAARLLECLLAGASLATSVPGPAGRPGGYPVSLGGRRIELRLPKDVTEAEAVEWNQRAALHDGVQVRAGDVVFAPAVEKALRPYLPDRAAGFPVAKIDEVGSELLSLRQRLREA